MSFEEYLINNPLEYQRVMIMLEKKLIKLLRRSENREEAENTRKQINELRELFMKTHGVE